MSETKKIKKEELESIQDLVRQINNGQIQVGQIETQKHTLLHQIAEVQKSLKEFQDKLEESYGKVNVNIVDGTITSIEEKDEQANT
jgi:chaperonin cofactor prefoldin